MAWSLLINGFVGILAGIVIGVERQWQKKLAGIRTTALLCFGASMFVTLSTLFVADGSPTRIAAQVVSGVGFLAGGVIIRDGYSVTGINTAATLWCSAAVGAIIGAGFHVEGLLCAVMLMGVNIALRSLSRRVDDLSFFQKPDHKHYYLAVTCLANEEIKVRTSLLKTLNELNLNFNQIVCGDPDEGRVNILIDLEFNQSEANAELKIKTFTEKLIIKKNIIEVQRIGLDME